MTSSVCEVLRYLCAREGVSMSERERERESEGGGE